MISEHPDDIILLDYVEGMLQGQASDSVRRHIATCRACRRTLAELSDTVSELERLPTAEIPHDSFGGPGRAGMLRALARFVPVVLAATALVCAILFTRSGAGRRNDTTQAAGAAGSRMLALPVSITRESLKNDLIAHWTLPDVAVLAPRWADGYVVMVPDGKVDQARTALSRIQARRTTPDGATCTGPVAGQCIAVTVKGVPAARTGEHADAVGATS